MPYDIRKMKARRARLKARQARQRYLRSKQGRRAKHRAYTYRVDKQRGLPRGTTLARELQGLSNRLADFGVEGIPFRLIQKALHDGYAVFEPIPPREAQERFLGSPNRYRYTDGLVYAFRPVDYDKFPIWYRQVSLAKGNEK